MTNLNASGRVFTWTDFGAAAPNLESFGRQRLEGRVGYLATIRANGSPRVHPVAPFGASACIKPTGFGAVGANGFVGRTSGSHMCGAETASRLSGNDLHVGRTCSAEMASSIRRTASFKIFMRHSKSPEYGRSDFTFGVTSSL